MISRDIQEFYRSSHMREAVLSWYPFERGAYVLDLSGGALSDLLNDRCGSVITDGSRCEGLDYIIAIDPENFSVETLTKYREKLCPHGRLLLAYENPFALRYWAGKKAPNTGLPYDTLFGRGNMPLPSKAELRARLTLAGFEGQKWYYPLTDHWLTMEVYSECYLPNEYLNQRFMPYIADGASLQFDERTLYREIIRGGAFEFMCGAYLIEARVCGDDNCCPVDYAAITAYREPVNRFATTVRNDSTVRKTPLHPDGKNSVLRIHQNHEELSALGVDVVETRLEGDSLIMPRLTLPTLWDYWAEKLSKGIFDENQMTAQFDRIRDSIYKASKNGKCYWELVPANCFFDEYADRIIFFDQEYCRDNTSPNIALARAVKALEYSSVFIKEPRARQLLETLKKRYGLLGNWSEITKLLDSTIFFEVFGQEYVEYLSVIGNAAKKLRNEQRTRRPE